MQTINHLSQTIQSLEERLLQQEVRSVPDRVAELLADDFFEIGASGRTYDKAAILKSLSSEAVQDSKWTIEDFLLIVLTDNIVQARYRISENGTLRSSLWRKENDGWKMFFHQGTTEYTPD